MSIARVALGLALIAGCSPTVVPSGDSDTDGGAETGGEDAPGTTEPGEDSGSSSGGDTDADTDTDTDDPPQGTWCVELDYVDLPAVHGAVAADLDDDGRPELWLPAHDWDPVDETFTTTLRALALDGDPEEVTALDRPGAFASFVDIDGDGLVDALMQTDPLSEIYWLRGGAFDPTPHAADIELGSGDLLFDMDGDGRADHLQVTSVDYEPLAHVRRGDGAGGFVEVASFPIDGFAPLHKPLPGGGFVLASEGFCDFCTPDTEVLVASADGVVENRVKPGGTVTLLDAADVDEDGRVDVLVHRSPPEGAARIAWLMADGAGSFEEDVVLEVTGYQASGDFDLDGYADFVDDAGVWFGDGTGFDGPQPLLGEISPWSTIPADFDGDGRLDFVSPWEGLVWSIVECDGPYDPPPPPDPDPEIECGDGVAEGFEECDSGPACDDDCIPTDAVEWTTLVDGFGEWDCGSAVDIAPTGEIYATGFAREPGNERALFVVALDSDGAERWTDTYNATQGNDYDEGTGVEVEPGGDIYVSGKVFDTLLWLRRYTPAGDVVWTEQAGSLETEIGSAEALTLAEDGLPIIVGESDAGAWIGKFDGTGSLLWDATAGWGTFTAVGRDAAGNISAIGYGPGASFSDESRLVSFDATGGLRWEVTGTHEAWRAVSGGLAPDGRTVVAQQDRWSGDHEWVARFYDDTGEQSGAWEVRAESLWDIFGTAFVPNGDVVFVGSRDGQAWIRRVEADGTVAWDRSFGDGDLYDAEVDTDGSIVVTGCHDSDFLVRRFAG